MKLNLKEKIVYGEEEFLSEDSPLDIPEDVPKKVAERVEEKGKGNIVEDIGEEETKEEEVVEKEVTFPEDEDTGETTVEVQESGPILDPGVYYGEITGLVTRKVSTQDGQAKYLDIKIEAEDESGEETEITTGYPLKVTRRTMLGKLLKRFGSEVEAGEEIPLEDTLVGREVRFQVKENEEGYADVIRDTLRPA